MMRFDYMIYYHFFIKFVHMRDEKLFDFSSLFLLFLLYLCVIIFNGV